MPVSLTVETLNAPFKLVRYDDDVVVNPTLQHLLSADYGILPTIIDSSANNLYVTDIQVEIGDAVTDYAPFVTPESFAYAERVTSISPDMTLMPNQDGVILEVTYTRDSNKVSENITNAIISLGGNV